MSRLRPTWAIIFARDLDQIIERSTINRADGIDVVDTVNQTSFETGYSQNILIGFYLASGLVVELGKDFSVVEQETLF